MNRRHFVTAGLGLAASTALARRQSTNSATRNFDIAIIGAGLFGSAAARHLSAIGDDVALIGPAEPSRPKAHQDVFASHYDESRLVRGIDPDLTWATLATRSIEHYRNIESVSGISFYHDIGYMMVTPGGLGEDWFDLPAMREVAADMNVEIEDLDYDALRARFPYLSYTPGSSAVLQRNNAGYINPRRLLEAQHKISIANGTTLIRDIVANLRRDGEQILVRTLSGNLISANKVLIATGAYTNALELLPHKLDVVIEAGSIEHYRNIESVSGISFYHDIGYMMVTPGGLGEDWFDLPAMREVAADMNVEIEDLDYDALRARFPYLSYTPGSSAVLQRNNAGYINPRRLLEAQHKISIANGTTLIRDIVANLRRDGEQILVRTLSGNLISANKVLIATGAYTNALDLLPHKLDVKIRAAMIMESEVVPGTQTEYPTTLYAKTDGKEEFWGLLMPPIVYPNGRSYIKTMDGYYGPAPLEGFEELGNWSRSNGHENHHEVLRRALREVFPSLDVVSTHFKPCLIMDTASHFPYIDMVDDRIGLVVGGNGKAAKSSDEIGRIAAGMIGNGEWLSSTPRASFSARFI